MKQIKNILLLILTLAIALGSLTSCDMLGQLGITLPGMGDNGDNGDNGGNTATCDEHVTYTKDAVSATCTEQGYTGDEVCYFCGAVVTAGQAIEKTAHNYVNGKCSVCGDETDAPSKAELWASQYETITIAEALALCEQFVSSPSSDRYYIIATVKSVDNTSFGQLTIEDETGEIMVYGTNSADGSLKYDKMGIELKEGDLVLLYGTLQNYKGTTKEVQNGWLIDYEAGEAAPKEPTITPDTEITIADAIKNAGLVQPTDRFYITATVKTVTKAQFGAMILIDENGDEISVYGSYNEDGSIGYAAMEDKPYKGDTVTVYATLQLFNGTPEIQNARIISFEHAEFDDSLYTAMSVADARNAAKDSYIKLTGVVASITYANGYVPAGFFLVDGTESIYVYDRDAAARVQVGNTVTVAGQKDFWILDTEINSAEKFGYKGCNQLANAYVLANDEGNTDFDKSWITESTVKEIMDTPITTDITTTIFKVTALVKKAPGDGFINYYIDDIDGITGTYVYTQCNGGDFAWLDQFDGKICTVYLSVINAKSNAAGCIWRFHPVAVTYENYQFDTNDAPKFAVDYYGVPSFESAYMTDAKLELITEVSSELLGFSGATLSYTVSDATVAEILTEDGKLYFHTLTAGTVVVTVTGSYNGRSVSEDITITVSEPAQYDSITAGQAAKVENETEVIVQGIVGGGVANQKGAFYLICADGVIPVRGTNEIMNGLSIGDEIVVKGTKTVTKDGGGQIVIDNAEILANFYGNHEYSTDSFIKDATMADIKAVADTPEATTNVYVITVTVTKKATAYSTTFNVGDVQLYSGNGAQYAWLEAYFAEGETSATLTLELALCDWNAKGLKGCVLAVYNEDGTKTYNPNNFGA